MASLRSSSRYLACNEFSSSFFIPLHFLLLFFSGDPSSMVSSSALARSPVLSPIRVMVVTWSAFSRSWERVPLMRPRQASVVFQYVLGCCAGALDSVPGSKMPCAECYNCLCCHDVVPLNLFIHIILYVVSSI
jgi:hypothetical protein